MGMDAPGYPFRYPGDSEWFGKIDGIDDSGMGQ